MYLVYEIYVINIKYAKKYKIYTQKKKHECVFKLIKYYFQLFPEVGAIFKMVCIIYIHFSPPCFSNIILNFLLTFTAFVLAKFLTICKLLASETHNKNIY